MIRDTIHRVRQKAHSCRENVPDWFPALSLALILIVSTAALPVSAVDHTDSDDVIYDFESGDDDWSSDPSFTLSTNQSLAYEGRNSYRFEGQGSIDTADLNNIGPYTPDSVSGRIRFASLPSDDGDVSWTEFIVRDRSDGGAWGTFQIRDGGSLYRSVSGDQNSYTDTGIDLQAGQYYTLTFANINYTASTVDYVIDGPDMDQTTIATDVSTEFSNTDVDAVELVGDTSTYNFDFIAKNGISRPSRVSGEVTDEGGEPLANAEVVARENGTQIDNATTNDLGRYDLSVSNGTYQVEASKPGYFNDSADVTVEGQNVNQNFQLRAVNNSITIDTRNYLKHGARADYSVYFYPNGSGQGVDITDETNVLSGDTEVITVNRRDTEIEATSNTSINRRTYVQAAYSDGNQTYRVRKNVTVANSSVENLALLPPSWRVNATFGDSTIQAILVAIFAGVFGARFSTAFGGLGLMELVMVAGWFTGYNSVGITMISLFACLFIGLNLAANIDYTVRR